MRQCISILRRRRDLRVAHDCADAGNPAGVRQAVAIALNAAQPAEPLGLCFAIPPGDAPAWVELVPAPDANGIVRGRDGRQFQVDPAAIVAAYDIPIPIDVNHATVLRAKEGEDSPAYGWINQLEVRNGAIWGQVEWTERGKTALANRDYRFLSPALNLIKGTMQAVKIASAGLVNEPNFPLALNHRTPEEDPTVDKAIREALGLKDDADAAAAVIAINALKTARDTALNRAETPSLDKFVPRADYDTALNRATAAEAKLADQDKAAHQAKVDTAINAALAAGKITPATKDYHVASCATAEGLAAFEKFVAVAPVIGDESGLNKKTPGTQTTALNAATAEVAKLFGNSAEDIKKYGTEEAA